MSTSNVIFCTTAFNQHYVSLAQELIDSFLKYTKDSQIYVLTNDQWAFMDFPDDRVTTGYGNYDRSRVTLREQKYPYDGSFPFNITYRALGEALHNIKEGNVLCYLDADCRIKNKLTDEHFSTLKSGLNVPFSFAADGKYNKYNIHSFPVAHIIEKLLDLAHGDGELEVLQFREACLIFSDIRNPLFSRFLDEWEILYYQVENMLHTHGGQFMEINLALKRSGLPLNDIILDSHFPYLQSSLMTLNYRDWTSEVPVLR